MKKHLPFITYIIGVMLLCCVMVFVTSDSVYGFVASVLLIATGWTVVLLHKAASNASLKYYLDMFDTEWQHIEDNYSYSEAVAKKHQAIDAFEMFFDAVFIGKSSCGTP